MTTENVNIPKLGVLYATNDAYAMPTCVSLCSVLENNRNADEHDKVEVIAYVYCDKWSEQSIQNLRTITDKYECDLHIMDPSWCYDKLAGILEPDTYAGTFAAEVRLFAPIELDVDYNIVCLDSDVIMISGNNLRELALYDFSNRSSCCASTIDLQSGRLIKNVANMGRTSHVYNIDGIFLVNPVLYKKYNMDELMDQEFRRVAYVLNPYWMMVRNGYVFKERIEPLDMKYQVYPPMGGLIKKRDWMRIFGLENEEYYSDEIIDKATEEPVFVHYVNWLVKKPWMMYPYFKETIPYHDEWDKFQELTPYREMPKKEYVPTQSERIRYFMYHNFYKLYVKACAIGYRRLVKKRNKIVINRANERGVKL